MQRHAPTTCKTTSFARTYPGKPDLVRWMRADLRAFLDGCPALDDLLLVADEFCANAVTHSKSGQPGGSFDVHVHAAIDDHVRVEVRDNGGRWLDSGHDDRPHGLAIVAAVAGDGNWGVDGDDLTGHTVWARLDWTHRREAT
jgi:anti-sigma regulatory factor (Ser/Thr protein kinase)